jgi:UDP-N-acetylglucosamine--N-acetylmuramyl-(pentapeptide) pyrophosphoryl-undecaprenol N-acetylglucosamine transferase
MKVVVIGGHLSPALAVIEELKGEEVYFIGRKHALEGDSALSLEYQTISKMGLPFFEIKTGRLQRKLSRHTVLSLSKFPFGLYKTIKILKTINPDVIIGFGGYVQVPVVIAARFLRIPVVLHEQTLEAGFANKLLASLATKICISFESSREFFPKNKSVLTGLPLKRAIIEAKTNTTPKAAKLPKLYITGGSLGSHRINDLVYKNLAVLLQEFEIGCS